MRRLVGLIAAPVPAAAIVSAVDFFVYGSLPADEDLLIGIGWMYGSAALFGIPAAAILDRRENGKAISYALCGAVILMVPMALIFLGMAASGDLPETGDNYPLFFAYIAGMGVVSGAAYWLIARPDRRLTSAMSKVENVFD